MSFIWITDRYEIHQISFELFNNKSVINVFIGSGKKRNDTSYIRNNIIQINWFVSMEKRTRPSNQHNEYLRVFEAFPS